MIKLVNLVVLGLAMMIHLGGVTAVAQAPEPEYKVKAAFLFNFIKYVEWPPATFPEKNSPYIVGILGDEDPFFDGIALTNYLEGAIKDKVFNERKLIVRRSNRISNLKDCHLVFVSKSERNRWKEIIAFAQANHILTVSEMDGFCQQGGVINFTSQSGKLRFEINPGAAERTGLKVSSKLLNVARIVSQPR